MNVICFPMWNKRNTSYRHAALAANYRNGTKTLTQGCILDSRLQNVLENEGGPVLQQFLESV
jgi:hypothetical protein